MAAAFNAEAWVQRFAEMGGVLALNADDSLWLGVIGARPDRGAGAAVMKVELSRVPAKLQVVELLVRSRLRR